MPVRKEIGKLVTTGAYEKNRWLTGRDDYLSIGLYARQIKRYMKFYSREDILCLSLTELKDDTLETLRRICRFISISDDFDFDVSQRYNVAYVPRLQSLEHFIRHRLWIKNLFKALLPRSLQIKLREVVVGYNTIPLRREKIPKDTRQILEQFYREENLQLQELFPNLKFSNY